MKRTLLSIAALSLLALSACKGPAGPAGQAVNGETLKIPLIVVDSDNRANALAAANGTIVTVGYSGWIFTSPDADTWTDRTDPGVTTYDLFSVAGNGGSVFVAVGDSGTIIRSADSGATWAVATTVPSTGALSGVAYGAGAFVAVGSGLTGGGVILRSTDGGDVWTATTPGTPPTFRSVSFANGGFFAGAISGELYSSANGSAWSADLGAYLGAGVLGVSYGGGTFLATDSNGAVSSSENGADWSPIYLGIIADNFLGQCCGGGGFAVLTEYFNSTTGRYLEQVYWTSDTIAWYQSAILQDPDGAYTSINWVPFIHSFVVTDMPAM
jgi:photosystem II stability/assembly factor-like uncharacterized protein